MLNDWQIYKNLRNLQDGYDSLLEKDLTPRQKYLARKSLLDENWQADLLPVMSALYWYPFRNGVDGAPEKKRELKRWLKRQYDDEAAVMALLLLLFQYGKIAYNLGGQSGLDYLNIDRRFQLSNIEILMSIDDRYRKMVAQDTEYSLIDTTVNDLAEAIPQAREGKKAFVVALSAFIAARSAERTVAIERYERPFQVGQALDAVYRSNNIKYKMYDVNGVGCPKKCAPWHGKVFAIGSGAPVTIPQHSGCDCIWSPVRFDGQVVGSPPVTVSVPGLPKWEQPAIIWTGA